MSTNYPVKRLVVHCSASPLRGDDAEDVHRWHLDNGWDGIGYHWVITEDKVQAGRPEYWVGSHVKDFNKGSIGVMLFGRGPQDFTENQMGLLANLCRQILVRHPYIEEICGHCDLDPVNKPYCPGFDVKKWAKEHGIGN